MIVLCVNAFLLLLLSQSYEALMGNVQSWWARGPVPMCPPYTPLSPDSPPEVKYGSVAFFYTRVAR